MKTKNHILIVDDLLFNRITFADILKDQYEILEAENGSEAFDILEKKSESIALIILDLVMPVMDGYEFLKRFQEKEIYHYIPIIVSTANDSVENERKCLELGAWDFISKTFHPDIIRFRVSNAIDKSKVRFLEYDALTGIYSKQRFFQTTAEMLDHAKEEDKLAFIYFDIDRFKMISTLYGASVGDQLISYVAYAIRVIMDEYGKANYGRIAADIFGICMVYEQIEDIYDVLKHIKERIKKYTVQYYFETCAGIYLIEDRKMDVSEIYHNASIAATQCKENYMMHEALYTEELREKLRREQHIFDEMDQALKDEQFTVYFQPKYELKGYSLGGAEALVRWKKPDGTMVLPGEFVPIFEKNGFITKLDYYVWEKVCQFLRKELDEGREPEPISVNVSRVNLYDPKFLETLIDLVEKYKISPRYLHLELTEGIFSDSEKVIRDAVKYLHKAGFTILMDDFGSGYSSLNVLKDVDLDVLKIDMKFFSQGETEEKGEKIIESVIRMAEALDMTVIAEGVENQHQVDFLTRLGCNYIQGYYFAKPMPEEQYKMLMGEEEKEKKKKEEREMNSTVFSYNIPTENSR